MENNINIRENYPDSYNGDDEKELVLKCPCCGEELSINDFVYTGYNGKIVGCEHCLTSHFAENMEEVYND